MTEYYRTDSSRINLAEQWRLQRSLVKFVLVLMSRLLGIRAANSTIIPRVEVLDRLEPEAVPGWAREQTAAVITACEAAGLCLRFFHRFPVLGSDVEAVEGVLTDDEGEVLGVVAATRARGGYQVRLNLFSLLVDGRWLVTVDSARQLDPPPGQDVAFLPGAAPAAVLAAHRRRAGRVAGGLGRIEKTRLADTVLGLIHDLCDYYVRRGIYVPMNPQEAEHVRTTSRANEPR
jgi:hypothetical protein